MESFWVYEHNALDYKKDHLAMKEYS